MLLLVTGQIEQIINVIGTPSVEEIYCTGRTKSRDIILKMGKVTPKRFEDMFPKANADGNMTAYSSY